MIAVSLILFAGACFIHGLLAGAMFVLRSEGRRRQADGGCISFLILENARLRERCRVLEAYGYRQAREA